MTARKLIKELLRIEDIDREVGIEVWENDREEETCTDYIISGVLESLQDTIWLSTSDF